MAKTMTVEEAAAALAEAQQAKARVDREERAKAEAQAQIEHDKQMAKVVAELEATIEKTIAEAAKVAASAPVSRGAALGARGFISGEAVALPAKPKIVQAVEHDPAATMLLGAFESVVAAIGKMAPNRSAGRRGVGPDLAQRLVDCERKAWGALYRRLHTLAGE